MSASQRRAARSLGAWTAARSRAPHLVAVLLGATLAEGRAAAQDAVEEVLRRGIALRTEGRDDEALALFRAAYERAPTPLTAGQLGLCEQALGRWIDAERHLREALAAPDHDWVRRNRAALDNAYATNAQHVAVLDLRGGPAGAEVILDGLASGRLPLSTPLRALVGEVTLEVRADGHYPLTRRVPIAVGVNRETIELRPRSPASPAILAVDPPPHLPTAPEAAPSPSRPPAAPPASPRYRTLAWAGVGVSAALAVTAVTALGVREDAAQVFNRSCRHPAPAGSPCAEVVARGDTMVTLAITTGTLAVALAVGSAIVLRLDANAPRRAGGCAPTFGGVGCAWSF